MTRFRILTFAAFVLGLSTAEGALAQVPPFKLALELNARSTVAGDKEAAESVARRVAVHLTPLLEAQGFEVLRVHHARTAAKKGDYHVAVRVDIDARPIYHVRDALMYEDDHGRQVIVDHSASVEAWGSWRVYDAANGRLTDRGPVDPAWPEVQSGGAGSPELDDEESIARRIAEAASAAILPALAMTEAVR